MKRNVLVVDVGGKYVKLLRSSRDEREFPSGSRLKPQQLIAKLKEAARGWKFDRASIGFPAPVRKGRIAKEPKHLGKGWIGFNFARALGIPVRLVNDAALQALGSYRGGRMLFLGLCTGLGSALIWVICRIARNTSLKITLAFRDWRCWARKNGSEKWLTRSRS